MSWIFFLSLFSELTNRRSVALGLAREGEQHKRAKASMETTPVPSMSVPKGDALQSVRSRVPRAPEGTPPQEGQTWPGRPSGPPPELEDTPRSDHTFHSVRESDRELDANHSWNPRERVIIRGMEDYLGRSEDIMVEVEELETCLLGPSDVAGIIIAVLAKNACD